MIYGLNRKDANVICSYIINFCSHNDIPKEFFSDNGKEFQKKILDEYCTINNIKFCYGMLFNLHSQGSIERFNYTIKKVFV